MGRVATADDLLELRDRLSSVFERREPLVFLFGAGASIASMPSTADLTKSYLLEMSVGARARYEAHYGSANATERYQEAARILTRTHDDSAVATVVQSAVRSACRQRNNEDTPLAALVEDAEWSVPPTYRSFARFYAAIEPRLRRPILTTNFDPLIEIALRDVGLKARHRTIAFDNPPQDDVLLDTSIVNVLHLHGYFENYNLHLTKHLTAPRPNVLGMLDRLFASATVCVIGYSGWDDVFMAALKKRQQTRAFSPSNQDARIVWAAFNTDEDQVKENLLIKELDDSPGFDLFLGIDASEIFPSLGPAVHASAKETPNGWALLPVDTTARTTPLLFSDGAEPSWSDAVHGEWPRLEIAEQLREQVAAAIADSRDAYIAAIGPTGEGKSLALRQLASEFAADKSLTVLWREAGAAALPPDFQDSPARAILGTTIFCIDDADLAADDLRMLTSNSSKFPTIVLVAAQDRLFWSMGAGITSRFTTRVFEGFTNSDAKALIAKWDDLGLISAERLRLGKSDLATKLIAESHGSTGRSRNTLLGAILAVRAPATLKNRIGNLIERLASLPIQGSPENLHLGHVFGAIALLELYSQKTGFAPGGASRSFIREFCRVSAGYPERAVLQTLGREASVVISGNFVYTRHPRIADAALSYLDEQGQLIGVVEQTSITGGRLRVSATASDEDWRDPYWLASKMTEARLAIAAASGARLGAPRLIEPRVSYVTTLRKFDLKSAREFALGLASNIDKYSDPRGGVRVLMNEVAQVELASNHMQLAAGLASVALHDGTGREVNLDEMSYAFNTLARSLVALAKRSGTYSRPLRILKRVAALSLPTQNYENYLARTLKSVADDADLKDVQLHQMLGQLSAALSPLVREALKE